MAALDTASSHYHCHVQTDLDLGNASPDTFDGTLLVDIHSCDAENVKALMAMAVGGTVERRSDSKFAKTMAEQGYTTVVMEVRLVTPRRVYSIELTSGILLVGAMVTTLVFRDPL